MIAIHNNPTTGKWDELLRRPVALQQDLAEAVKTVMNAVKAKGDEALLEYSERFDGVTDNPLRLRLKAAEIRKDIDQDLAQAIDTAYENIYKFHKAGAPQDQAPIETSPGVTCWRKILPIQSVGLYVPGGTAPLFSTVLMLGIPAQIAGCSKVILCTPPRVDGQVHPAIAYAALKCGIDTIYTVGGSQAIAALTYGTETIPQVDKIFGPGNSYVMEAKQQATTQGVAIDMPAGPSEVLIIADQSAHPAFVAADLLAQAEHGPDSQVILLTDSDVLAREVNNQLREQVSYLDALSRKREEQPRTSIIEQALQNSRTLVLENLEEAIAASNQYAPEHLIINTANPEGVAARVTRAGSIFLGPYTCESLGDYASGTNHTLPTAGYARNYSGVSVDSFVNKVTLQRATEAGIHNLGPVVQVMARAEGLYAHENAVTERIKATR